MTKRERLEREHMFNALQSYGVTRDEFDTLRRCSMTLHRWAERECGDGSNWAIERDDNGIPYNRNHVTGTKYRIADRETGALKRAAKILQAHGLTFYHQSDPRGCALYALRPNDVPSGASADSYYTRGIAIY